MTKARSIPIESYALFPMLAALSVLAIDRSGLLSWFKFFLFIGLFVIFDRLTRSSGSIFVLLAAVLIDKSLFFNPLIPYVAGVLIGGHLFFQLVPHQQRQLSIGLGLIYSLGLIPLLLPHSSLRWALVLLIVASTGLIFWLVITRKLAISEFAINPRDYLDPKLLDNDENSNRDRLAFFCVFFLTVGAPAWSQLVEVAHFRIAAVVYLASILIPTALLAVLKFPFDSIQYPEEVALVPVGPSQAELLAALEAERRKREREQLLLEEQHFYFGRGWDQLVASFSSRLETTLPDGSRIPANDHLLIGLASYYDDASDLRYKPIFLHRPILHEHVHILGGTGSGKTSLAITPLVIQLIRGYAISDDGTPSEPEPIVIFDVKGDAALFHTAKEEARVRGQDFLHFTVDPTKTSFYFNPFFALRKYGATIAEQAHELLDALSLNHGEAYGASYFTRMNRQGLLQVLRSYEGTPQSLRDIYDRLRKDTKKQKKAEELFAALEGLIDYPQLFTTKEQEENEPETIIDFERVLEKNQVVYFSLMAPTQSVAIREIGKLAIYSFFLAAIRRRNAGSEKQAYMVIDEFQRLAGENLEVIIEQAREFKIAAILANQNIAQLKSRNGHLWSLVQSNVSASLHFGSGDPEELKLLSEHSGQIKEQMRSVTETKGITAGGSIGTSSGTSDSTGSSYTSTVSRGTSESKSWSETRSTAETFEEAYRPLLRIEDLSRWFNKKGRFICWVRRASGLSDYEGLPIKVEGLFTMDLLTYRKRQRLPWPDGPRPSLDSPKGKAGPSKERLSAILNDNFRDD